MRSRSLHGHGRTCREPRSPLAHPQGRRPGRRATRGFSPVTSFAKALRRRSGANGGAGREAALGRMPAVKKVARSSAGGAEAVALLGKSEKRARAGFQLSQE